MLHHLAQTLDTLTGLVSFNGKAFDLPLLETRFLLSRLRPDLLDAPHLDLLFPSRCLWRARISSCALSSLEQNVLDVRRNGQDVPGFLIPAMYFNYLQTGDAAEISRVFYHNAQDILSLVVLSAQVCRLFHSPDCGEPAHGLDLLSLGRLCERLGSQSEAERAYRHALAVELNADVRSLLQEQLSFVCKREGRWAEAVELWEGLCAAGCRSITPHVELAKYYEHHAADVDRAIALVLEARRTLPRLPSGARPAESRAELEYRLDRLRRKKGKVRRSSTLSTPPLDRIVMSLPVAPPFDFDLTLSAHGRFPYEAVDRYVPGRFTRAFWLDGRPIVAVLQPGDAQPECSRVGALCAVSDRNAHRPSPHRGRRERSRRAHLVQVRPAGRPIRILRPRPGRRRAGRTGRAASAACTRSVHRACTSFWWAPSSRSRSRCRLRRWSASGWSGSTAIP